VVFKEFEETKESYLECKSLNNSEIDNLLFLQSESKNNALGV